MIPCNPKPEEWEEREVKGRRTHPFDGAASLLLPLVAAQLQGAVNIGFSVIGAQDEQSAGTGDRGRTAFIKPDLCFVFCLNMCSC